MELSNHTWFWLTSFSFLPTRTPQTSRKFASKKKSSPPSKPTVNSQFPPRVSLNFLLTPSHLCILSIGSDMASLYETLAADSVLEMDQAVLDAMRAKIDDELKKLDEK